MRTAAPEVTGEESREAPHNSHGDWTFLRQHERVPEVPVVTREEPQSFLPQLEKNQEILPSMRDEALFCCSISREIPPSLLSLQRVLDTLEATQEVPQHTRLHRRGIARVPPQLRKSPLFPSLSSNEAPFPSFFGRGIQGFPLHLKRRRSQLESREEHQWSCHHSKRP